MDIQKFRYALTIEKEASLTKAAEKLFITPSALSQHITKEEQQLGTALFVRTREKWTPTDAGRIYLDTANVILNMNDNMERMISDIVDCKTGAFTVGITPGRGSAMFSEIFPKFCEEYPGVKIHLIEANWKRLQRLTLENTVDLAFTSLCNIDLEMSPSLECEELAVEDFILFAPNVHPMAELYKKANPSSPITVDLSLFGNERFIGMSKETTLYYALNTLFKQAGISPDIFFESSSTLTVYNLVSKGFGLGILPYIYTTFDNPTKNAVWFKITPTLNLSVLAVNRKGYQKSTAMEYLISLARDYFSNRHNN